MEDYVTKVRRSINEAIEHFTSRINQICENGPYRKARKIPSTFPILNLGNNEFYEYAYFERTLEWFVRDLLINTILQDLFIIHDIESMWPDNQNYVSYSTESIENIFPFEFIMVYDGEKIGVRYTSLCTNEVAELINKYEIDKIVQIKWSEELEFRDSKHEDYDVVIPKTFFEKYFTGDAYEIFMAKVLPAIETANLEIGFETIPSLSLRYLSSFKSNTSANIRETAFDKMRFQVLPTSKEKALLGEMIFSENDYSVMNRNFHEVGLYKSLFGTEGFAKCFITAEYQYHIFKQGYNFDYTSVVCGYLKAVEQLIYKFMKIRLQFPGEEDLWIKCKSLRKKQREKLSEAVRLNPDPKSNATQILLKADYEMYFDITLNPLIWFIHDDVHGWNISDEARELIHRFLRNFADDCRNDHFHKDNIDSYETVTCIRNNTLLLLYLLLGGYRLTGEYQKDLELLGISDDSFDRLYKKIQEIPRGVNKFVIYFANKEPIKAYRHFVQEPTIYDENGSVVLSNIRFIEVAEFGSDEYEKSMQGKGENKEFLLQNDNIPLKISYINGRNEEKFITW